MKLFFKISFLVVISFLFCNSYAAKATLHENGIHQSKVSTENSVKNIAGGLSTHNQPFQKILMRLFHHGIDENFVFVSNHSNVTIFPGNSTLSEKLNNFQSWAGYFCSFYQTFPGYQVHLASLPLRSPPFSC